MYKNVLFKDKKDITDDFKQKFSKALFIGNRETIPDNSIEILSILFSKIGKQTIEQLPNLKWIVCRSHGYDNINLSLCKNKNIGVCLVKPFILSVSSFILRHLSLLSPPYCFYGYGDIAKTVSKELKDKYYIINSQTSQNEVSDYLKQSKTIIITIPYSCGFNEILGEFFFNKLSNQTNIISISRKEIFNYKNLINSLDKNKLGIVILDDVKEQYKKTLLKYPNVLITNHIAWKEQLTEVEYLSKIKETIDACFYDNPKHIIINRNESVNSSLL